MTNLYNATGWSDSCCCFVPRRCNGNKDERTTGLRRSFFDAQRDRVGYN